jgi:hypothetical protein
MDDQGTVHTQVRLAPSVPAARALAGILEYNGDSSAAAARSFLAELIATNGDDGDPWEKFLYADPMLPTEPFSAGPRSYFATGPGQIAVRSAWQKDAVWATFVAGPYINAPDSGEQSFNQGAIAVVQGDQPIVVNATGWLPQAAGNAGETFVYDDTWGKKTRLLNNTFYVAGAAQQEVAPATSQTHIDKYEDGSVFVHARGIRIADMYGGPGVAVSQFTREFAYLRPGTFAAYDRTTVGAASDQWLAWHTPTQPMPVTVGDATQSRFDVVAQGSPIGSVRTLLPRNATPAMVNLVGGAAWRLEMHAPIPATTQDWLTVVTAGKTVPEQTRLSASDGNVVVGSLVGVHVLSAPSNAVVLFNADHAGAATTPAATYVVAQTAEADHVLFDMTPSPSGYVVAVTGTNGTLTVSVTQGGSFALTGQGTLSFHLSMNGTVAPPPRLPAAVQDAGSASDVGSTSGSPTTDGGTMTSGAAVSGSSGVTSGGAAPGPGMNTATSRDAGSPASALGGSGPGGC